MGIDPFGKRYDRTTTSGKIVEAYENCTKEELQEKEVHVKVAGRIMTKRRQGKAGFHAYPGCGWTAFRFMYVKM